MKRHPLVFLSQQYTPASNALFLYLLLSTVSERLASINQSINQSIIYFNTLRQRARKLDQNTGDSGKGLIAKWRESRDT